MFLQAYVYSIVAILGTLLLLIIVYLTIVKIRTNDAPIFTEEEIAEDVEDIRAKLEYIAGIMGRMPSTPHYHQNAKIMDELLEVMKDGRHCIVSNYEGLGNRLDFICDVLAETPAGKRVIAEHPELLEELREESEEN